jgi:hypothetical protein
MLADHKKSAYSSRRSVEIRYRLFDTDFSIQTWSHLMIETPIAIAARAAAEPSFAKSALEQPASTR